MDVGKAKRLKALEENRVPKARALLEESFASRTTSDSAAYFVITIVRLPE